MRASKTRRMMLAALAFWPLIRAAAQPARRRLGILSGTYAGSGSLREVLLALRAYALEEHRNLDVMWRFTNDDDSRLDECARELVDAGVEVILTLSTPNTRAAAKATPVIPIVTGVSDPVGSGFARTLARPGGNVTGLSWGTPEQAYKQLELLRLVMPGFRTLFVLHEERTAVIRETFIAAARKTDVEIVLVPVATLGDLERFLQPVRTPDLRAAVSGIPSFALDMHDVARRAIAGRVAYLGYGDEWVNAGGLLAHAFFHRHQAERLAGLVALMFRGAKPAEQPFELPDGEWIGVNRKTAKTLGIVLTPQVLARANLVD